MNNVVLMGRLTKDVELRYNQSQMAIGRFTVAVNRRLTKEKDKRQRLITNLQQTLLVVLYLENKRRYWHNMYLKV